MTQVNNFSKKDLKTGMTIHTKAGKYVVMLNVFVGTHAYTDIAANLQKGGGFVNLGDYTEDLKLKNYQNDVLDVLKVTVPEYLPQILSTKDDETKVIWERNVKTPQQIELEALELKIKELLEQVNKLKQTL